MQYSGEPASAERLAAGASVEAEVQAGLTADSLGAGAQAPEGSARPSNRLRDIKRGDPRTPQLAGPDDVAEAEATGDEAESEAMSDVDGESDASDVFHIEVEPKKTWTTMEDSRIEAARRLAKQLRQKPLLPAHPDDPSHELPWTDVSSGVKLPAAHCAFKGCDYTDNHHSTHLASHVIQYHREAILECIWPVADCEALQSESEEEGRGNVVEAVPAPAQGAHVSQKLKAKIMAYYTAAIREVERQGVPTIGVSIDRRAFKHLQEKYNSEEIQSLMCFVCAQVKVHSCHANSDINYEQGSFFEKISKESFLRNLSFTEFRERYAQQPPLQGVPELADGNPEWRRTLVSEGPRQGAEMLCCPEDVRCCGEGRHADHEICSKCKAPVCASCRTIMLSQDKGIACQVPMALANDNFHGYASRLISQLKVRWIEAAVACPCWTAQIIYYLEGERGSMIQEELLDARARYGVRGNIFSFHMPWEQIMTELENAVKDDGELLIPRPPNVLCHMVKLHLRQANSEVAKHISEMKIRTHVVLQLGNYLIEQQHPALHNKEPTVLLLRERFKKAVEKMYPCPAEEKDLPEAQRQGFVPEEILDVVRESARRQFRQGPLQEKNATPAEGMRAPGEVFAHVRPQAVLEERTAQAGADPNTQEMLGLSKYQTDSTLAIQVGSSFLDQWKPSYLWQAFPFVLPYGVGGPEFFATNRERRKEDAVRVTPFDFVKGIARRCEAQFQNSWDFLPGVRNLLHRWTILNTPGALVRRAMGAEGQPLSTEASAAEVTEAAAGVYEKLRGGTYGDLKKPRPIGGDTTKLKFAHGLTSTERELVIDLARLRQALEDLSNARHDRARPNCFDFAAVSFSFY
jgi:hypothetical protein